MTCVAIFSASYCLDGLALTWTGLENLRSHSLKHVAVLVQSLESIFFFKRVCFLKFIVRDWLTESNAGLKKLF